MLILRDFTFTNIFLVLGIINMDVGCLYKPRSPIILIKLQHKLTHLRKQFNYFTHKKNKQLIPWHIPVMLNIIIITIIMIILLFLRLLEVSSRKGSIIFW